MKITISGIHTEIGKTITSAVIVEALNYDYWKPVQAGDLDNSDSIFIQNHISNSKSTIHTEAYRLNTPASPHLAAEIDGLSIREDQFQIPQTDNGLIIETAGGLMSPLATGFLNIDLLKVLKIPTILVSNNYLGSINHTLLSYHALKQAEVPILGLVFTGEIVESSRSFIHEHTRLPLLLSIPYFDQISKATLVDFARSESKHLKTVLDESYSKR